MSSVKQCIKSKPKAGALGKSTFHVIDFCTALLNKPDYIKVKYGGGTWIFVPIQNISILYNLCYYLAFNIFVLLC